MSQVLALKYRPSTFDKLIGQETITQTLTMALDQDRLSHAYLFSGLRGSGKTSTARIFAKSLVCDNGPTSTPCEVCENCKTANENRHIDIVEMDAASSRKIDDIRSLIEQTKYKPNAARFKIFIIDEVHMLTKEAFNALLKTLEEPPEYVKFILATTDPMKLPPTILSRTQHFRFKKINAPEVVKHLSHILNLENMEDDRKHEIEYEVEALSMLTRAGNGSLRDTLTLLDQSIIYSKNFVNAKSVASMLGILDPEFIDAIFDAIFKNDRDSVLGYVKELENYESEVVIDEIISYAKERFFQKDARFSTMLSDRFFRILSESKNLLFLNADSGFVLTLLFFKMIEATKIKDIDEMIDELEGKVTITKKVQTPQTQIQKEVPVPPTAPAPVIKEPEVEPQTEPIVESPVEVEVEIEVPKPEPEPVKQNPHAKTFDTLIEKLYDRNYELGECFKNSIEFVEFENDSVKLISCASQECKKTLRQSSGIIKHFVQDTFGFEAKISMIPCPEDKEMPITAPCANEDTSSMIEEVEFKKEETPTDSCIANQVVNSADEIDSNDIMENEFVKKAQELFEPKKIIIKSKV